MKELDYQQRIRQLEEALRESEKREASVQERLQEAVSELDDVHHQLVITTRDLSDARKGKESLEVCYRSVRGMPGSMYAVLCAVELRKLEYGCKGLGGGVGWAP